MQAYSFVIMLILLAIAIQLNLTNALCDTQGGGTSCCKSAMGDTRCTKDDGKPGKCQDGACV